MKDAKPNTAVEDELPLLPVLDSWGSMIRETPSAGYGDMRFDPAAVGAPTSTAAEDTDEPSELDYVAAKKLEISLPL